MQGLLVREPLLSGNSRLASRFLYKVLAFEITSALRISNNLPQGGYGCTFQNQGVAVIQLLNN